MKKIKNLMLMIPISLALIGSGCAVNQPPAEKIVYIKTALPLPSRPTLPTWNGNDMSCLSPEMIQKIKDRDRLRKEYAEDLEAIIKSTH